MHNAFKIVRKAKFIHISFTKFGKSKLKTFFNVLLMYLYISVSVCSLLGVKNTKGVQEFMLGVIHPSLEVRSIP